MVQHSRDMFTDTCLRTHGGQICNLKSTCLIRTILDLLERVDALVLYINIQSNKYKLTAAHRWSFNTGGH